MKWAVVVFALALSACAGMEGAMGETGAQGPPGQPGMTGPAGPPGEMGAQGPAGQPGEMGVPGEAGMPGMTGRAGYYNLVDAKSVVLGKLITLDPFGRATWIDQNNAIWAYDFSRSTWAYSADMLFATTDCTGTAYEGALPLIAGLVNVSGAGNAYKTSATRVPFDFKSVRRGGIGGACDVSSGVADLAPTTLLGPATLPALPLSVVPAN